MTTPLGQERSSTCARHPGPPRVDRRGPSCRYELTSPRGDALVAAPSWAVAVQSVDLFPRRDEAGGSVLLCIGSHSALPHTVFVVRVSGEMPLPRDAQGIQVPAALGRLGRCSAPQCTQIVLLPPPPRWREDRIWPQVAGALENTGWSRTERSVRGGEPFCRSRRSSHVDRK
jgi:hypothetical protein